MMPKLAVLVSGKGTILRSIIEHKLPVQLIVADRACQALSLAFKAQAEARVMLRKFDATFDDAARHDFSERVAEALEDFDVHDVVAMAGWGTILSPVFFEKVRATILNVHPSLLPAFKGKDAVGQAFHGGAEVTGCTVHVATSELDSGPILAQSVVRILHGDTLETLHERIQVEERKLYPSVIEKFLNGMMTAH